MAEVYLGVGIDASGAQQGAAQYDNAAKKVTEGAKKATKENEALTKQIKEAQKVIQLQQKQLDSVGGALDQYKMALGQARLAVSQKQKQIDSIKQALMQYENALRTAEKAVRDQGKEIESLKQKLEDSNNKIKESQKTWEGYKSQINNTLLVVKAFAAATAALAVREISNFTQELSNARAMTGASGEDMDRLSKVIRELGASTVFSAAEVAKAAAELGKAGFNTQEIMTALPATLDLASAATIGIAEASKITANVMNGFGLSTADVGRAADILGAIAINSATDVSGLGEAMKYAGPPSKMLGISLETTAAAMATMAQNGLEGGQAGRNFASMLFALLKPSGEAKKAIKELGLSIDDINPSMNKIEDIIKRFTAANIDATQAAIIFGAEGFRAFSALSTSPEIFEKMVQVIGKADGSLRTISQIKLDNIAGDFERLTGGLSETANALGAAGLEGTVRGFIQTATKWVDSLNQTFEAISKNKEAAALLSDVMGGLALTVGGVIVLKLAEWLYGAAAAFAAAGTAASAFVSALVLLSGGAAIGALAYLAKLRMETIDLEAETRKQECALLDMGGAYGKAARMGELALLQLQRAQLRTRTEITKDIIALQNQSAGTKNAGDPFAEIGGFGNERDRLATAQIQKLQEELSAVSDVEKKILDLKNNQYYFDTMSNAEAREKVKNAKDYADQIVKAMFYPVGTPTTAQIVAPTTGGNVTPGAATLDYGKKTEASKAFFGTTGSASSVASEFEDTSRAFWGVKEAVSSTNEDMAKYYEHNQKILDTVSASYEKEVLRNGLMREFGGNVERVNLEMAIQAEQNKLDVYDYDRKAQAIRDQMTATSDLKIATDAATEAKKKQEQAEKQWANSMTYAFKDAIMNSKNLGDALSNLANRVQDMLVNKALDSLLGGFFGGFSKGAAFQAGGVTAFASGGVVSQPSFFPMSGNRTGLMGEAGPEAIMPLTRTSSGDLGVRAIGGGGTTVIAPVVNISISGGSEEQNNDAATKVSAAVRDAIDDVVMNVLLREKRPGGSLT